MKKVMFLYTCSRTICTIVPRV